MARSKGRTVPGARDYKIATRVRPVSRVLTQVPVPAFDLLPGADRRRFHPERRIQRPLVRHPTGEAKLTRFFYDPRLHFISPERVLICSRRKERREVLFARRTLGSGGAGRRTPLSNIQCRRGGR